MNRRRLAVVIAILGAGVLVAIILLVTGGTTGPGEIGDARGDAVQSEGEAPPKDPDIADAVDVRVTHDGDEIVFSASLAKDLPKRLADGTVDYRWDVIEQGTPAWIVSASLDIGLNASVIAQQGNFGASTIDDSLPGSVELDGDTFTIRLSVADIEGFPTSFEWTFRSTLDGDRGNPKSAVVEDTVPDSGTARLD